MMLRKIILPCLCVLLVLTASACDAGSATPLPPPTPTETATPTPLITLIPTTTPFPSVTPDIKLEAVKQVLVEYGTFGGGGDTVKQQDLYLGRDVPSLIIYTDGQIITNQGGSLLTSQMTPSELCLLMGKLQSAGFFGADLFSSKVPVQSGDEPTLILQVNGTPSREVFIPKYDLPFISVPISKAIGLLNDLKPNEPTFYEPQRLLLWVQPVAPEDVKGLKVFDWPASLPSISHLWSDRTLQHALLEGSTAAEVLSLFSHKLQTLYFSEQKQVYQMIARPLLPHETSTRYSIIPDRTTFFDSPVSCLGQAYYAPTPSPSPTLTQAPPTPEATLSPQRAALSGRGRILFNSDRSGNLQIYMMNSDGSSLVRLTNNLASDQSPAFSPDGQKIAFISNRDGNDEIYLMNADGTNPQRLTHSVDDEATPDWSPDGKHLVYTLRCNSLENCTGHQELYEIDIDGNNPRQLTDTVYNAFLPAWRPDGGAIAFVLGNQQGSSIYYISAQGGKVLPLIDRTDINVSMPTWSPDGTRLAYVVWDVATYQSELYVSNADGTQPHRLTNEGAAISEPIWSPDSAWIAFSLRKKDPPGEHIMVVSAAPATGIGRPLALTEGLQNDTRPSWGK
jgi:TolB protein